MKHKKLKLIAIVLLALIVGVLIYIFTTTSNIFSGQEAQWKSEVFFAEEPIALEYWLPVEEKGYIEPIVEEYQKIHPNVSIKLTYIEPADYQKKLLAAASNATLPDMFAFRNDGLPLYKTSISTAPKEVFTSQSYTNTFVSLPVSELLAGNQVYGVPFGLATLAQIYNPETFAQKKLSPAKTWQDFEKLNQTLRNSNNGVLYESGVALGTASIRNYSDIISVLMIQNGANMTNQPPTKATFDVVQSDGYAPGAKALEFYASFARANKQNYSWSDSIGESSTALAEGKTKLILDYPMTIRQLQKRYPKVQLVASDLPQVNIQTPKNYGMYFAHSVSKNSKNPAIAWDFLGFATSKQQARIYSQSSLWPTARQDLVREQLNDKDLAPFARQISTATSWQKGNNALANTTLVEMLTNYQAGLDARIVVKNAATNITAILGQYLK